MAGIRIPQKANECPEDKYLNRHVVNEVAAACAYHPDVWRDLGIELLGQDGRAGLDVIKANHSDDVTKCCSAMLTLWRQRQTNASWRQLIEALKQLKLKRVATEIEKLLTGQEYTMQDLKITPMHNQQQDLQTASLQEESSIGPSNTTNNVASSSGIDFSECETISSAFALLMAEITKLLTCANFYTLRRAILQQRNTLGGVQFPDDLYQSIKTAQNLDTLLDLLVDSQYLSWVDLRLLKTLVMSSGIREAEILINKYKAIIFTRKLVDVLDICFLPQQKDHKYAYISRIASMIGKDPDEITVGDLTYYNNILGAVIKDISSGYCVLEHLDYGHGHQNKSNASGGRPQTPDVACEWYFLGTNLLNSEEHFYKLDVIKRDFKDSETACFEMFLWWLRINKDANWKQLIDALKKTNLNSVADTIENSIEKDPDEIENECLKIKMDFVKQWNEKKINLKGVLSCLRVSKRDRMYEEEQLNKLKEHCNSNDITDIEQFINVISTPFETSAGLLAKFLESITYAMDSNNSDQEQTVENSQNQVQVEGINQEEGTDRDSDNKQEQGILVSFYGIICSLIRICYDCIANLSSSIQKKLAQLDEYLKSKK